MRKFGPKSADHPSIGDKCAACSIPFKEGDFTAFITLGPGDVLANREKARRGLAYNAVCIEIHWDCAGH